MSTNPDVPRRIELTFELPGTPEQVWQAIATGPGITSWFLPTDLEEREGGTIVTHMGETESPGTVTGWDPPRRFVYEEPDWAALGGHEGAPVTPLVTEFLIEAQSGGTSVLRVVSSAFGTGADWEQEFLDDMVASWRPFFDRLRLYLAHFPGQHASVLEASHTFPGSNSGPVVAAMRRRFGIDAVGQTVEARGLKGEVERIGEFDVLLQVTDPVPGFLAFGAFDMGENKAMAVVHGQLFSDGAPAFVDREQPSWQDWVQGLETEAR